MSWLGDWLREIILVVLLASFVELLLPSKSMERYARLVLSLLVLLTMLNPIISFLKGDAISELSIAMEQQERNGGLFSGGGKGDATLEEILANGQQLAAGRQDQTLKLAAEEVAGQMKEQIMNETGKRGVNVTVTLGIGKSSNAENEEIPVIAAVKVSLPSDHNNSSTVSESSGTASTSTSPIAITPVEPVEVSIGAKAEIEPKAVNGNVADNNIAKSEMDSIVKLLELKWDLDPKVIQVEGGNQSTYKL